MNGIVAILTSLPARRLVRGILILGCCILSVGLIGAVHTRPIETARPNLAAPRAATDLREPASIDVDDAIPAGYQLPAQPKTPSKLSAAAANEMLRDVETIAASITTTVQKTLTSPMPPPTPVRFPTSPTFAVRWMEVTAYCACKKCCGPRAQGITASGRPVSYNGGRFVAADKNLAFNTKLLIPGYGDGQAVPVLDRGGAIKGNKLDVYFPSHQEARQWGRRFIPVTVMN